MGRILPSPPLFSRVSFCSFWYVGLGFPDMAGTRLRDQFRPKGVRGRGGIPSTAWLAMGVGAGFGPDTGAIAMKKKMALT